MTVPTTAVLTTTKPEFHEVSEVAALPADFPAKEIPTPPLRLVYTSGESGGLLLRYVSTDAKTDALAYRKVLVTAGYSVTGDALDLEGPTLAFTVVARNATHHLDINGMLATSGSQYLDVIVDKPELRCDRPGATSWPA